MSGMIPPTKTVTSSIPSARNNSQIVGISLAWAPDKVEIPNGTRIFVARDGDYLFRCPSQSSVDHLMTSIPHGPGNDFCTSIVPIKAGLCDDYPHASLHTLDTITISMNRILRPYNPNSLYEWYNMAGMDDSDARIADLRSRKSRSAAGRRHR